MLVTNRYHFAGSQVDLKNHERGRSALSDGNGGWSDDPWSDDEPKAPVWENAPGPGPTATPLGPTAKQPGWTGPPSRRGLSGGLLVAIIAAAVVVVGGATTVGVVLASHHSTTTTTLATTTLTTPTTAPSTTLSTAATTSSLLSNAPFDNCFDYTAAERGVPDATDEVQCTGSDVSDEGADEVLYAAFSSSSVAVEYLASLAPDAGTPLSDCGTVKLGLGTVFCDFTDNSLSGVALMSIGTNFELGPGDTTEGNCANLRQSSTPGYAVLLWTYADSNVVGRALSCVESTTPLAAMRAGLYASDFELNNQ